MNSPNPPGPGTSKPNLADYMPRRARLFARTPPAIFPAILGVLGLGAILRSAAGKVGLPAEPVQLILGAMVMFWAFAVVALVAKILRRPASMTEDLRGLPGRIGFAAATMSGMMAAAILVPVAPRLALWMAMSFLCLHAVVAVFAGRALWRMAAAQRVPSAPWHLAFVGFILGAVPLAELGWTGLAKALLFATIPLAAMIWGSGLAQVLRGAVPLPLRPVLAIHLAPMSLFSLVATQTGQTNMAFGFAGAAAALFVALILGAGWMTRGGFGPLWASFTFPLTAFAAALLALPDPWAILGLAMAGLALMIVPLIAWKVLRLWPGGRLAAKTNAAVA